MINFCHISPTAHLDDFCANQTHHLLLAHLVETDQQYRDWYKRHKLDHPEHVYIMDNSAFEMYKQGREMYPPEKLMDMGKLIDADYIVMTDYPNQPGKKTIESAEKLAPVFRASGFGTFFVPQSNIHDVDDYIETFDWAVHSPLVDYIGVSILGVPNAFGVERDNKLQRFLSRWHMMHLLEQRGCLKRAIDNKCKIHMLGLVDGYREIELIRDTYGEFISTWDSSAAVWYGLNGIVFDNSPSGALHGKFEKEVDFNFTTDSETLKQKVRINQEKINRLIK